MKKYIISIICFILMSCSCVWAAEAPTALPNVKIIINSEPKVFTDIPISVNGRTLLPLRQSLTYLGVPNDDQHIIWNQSDKSVTVKHGSTEIYLKLYDNKAKVNGTEITLPAASIIYKGRTYIPARFVAEALKKIVTWDDKYKAVYIAEEETYNQVKLILDKVLAETKNLKDTSYTVHYDLDVKLGGNVQKGLSETSEKHVGSDTIESDLISGVTHYRLGAQTGFTSIESTMPLAEEGYYSNDFSYIKNKGYKWSKSEFTDGASFSYSTETGSKTPRSSQIVLNSLNGVVGDTQYAGLKINDVLSNGDEIVLEGDIFSNYVMNKILSIIPTGKLGAQATMAVMFGGQVKSSIFKTVIFVDSKSNTIRKIEFTPHLMYEIASEGDPLSITLSGKITHDYSLYNKGLNLKVPDEVVKNATSGALAEDIPVSELITGRSSSDDYEKIKDLDTLDKVIGILGQGKKVSSKATDYYTWGNVDKEAYIEISFADGKVWSSGCTGNYQEDKYQKIKLEMSFGEVVGILGEGKKSKTEVTDCYEWKYSDGKTIQILVTNNKVTSSSAF